LIAICHNTESDKHQSQIMALVEVKRNILNLSKLKKALHLTVDFVRANNEIVVSLICLRDIWLINYKSHEDSPMQHNLRNQKINSCFKK